MNALLVGLLLWTTALASRGDYSIKATEQPIVESFADYDGKAAPENWLLSSTNEEDPAHGQASYQGLENSKVKGWRSYGADSLSPSGDRALGFLGNSLFGSKANPATMTAVFTNDTGRKLTNFSIGYVGEQWWAAAARNSFIAVSYSRDGVNYVDIPELAFQAPVKIDAGAIDGNSSPNQTVFFPVKIDIRSTPIAPGDLLYIRFSYSGGNGGGTRQGLAIDDVSVSAGVSAAH